MKPKTAEPAVALIGRRVLLLSRCAQTLYGFRRELAHAIQLAGAEVRGSGAVNGDYPARLRAIGVAFEPVPLHMGGVNPIRDLNLIRCYRELFDRYRPDVVHAFTVKPIVFGLPAAAAAGVPARVATITGLGHLFTSASWPMRLAGKWLYKLALRSAHLVFFQNPDDRAEFVSSGLCHEDKTRLIPGSGVDIQKFCCAPLPPWAQGRMTFLMVARLLRDKGVMEFAHAARVLGEKYPDVRFVLVGGRDRSNPSCLSEDEVRQLRQIRCLTIVGEVEDVREALAQCHVFVLPSYREGLPRSALEALAVGRPLVLSDVPGCRELVRDGINGTLVPAQDGEALAHALAALLMQADKLEVMGNESRRLAVEKYSVGEVARQTLDAYFELLSRRGFQ